MIFLLKIRDFYCICKKCISDYTCPGPTDPDNNMCGHDCGQTEFVQEGGENCFSITTTTALPINNQQDVPSPPFKRSYRLVPNLPFTINSFLLLLVWVALVVVIFSILIYWQKCSMHPSELKKWVFYCTVSTLPLEDILNPRAREPVSCRWSKQPSHSFHLWLLHPTRRRKLWCRMCVQQQLSVRKAVIQLPSLYTTTKACYFYALRIEFMKCLKCTWLALAQH